MLIQRLMEAAMRLAANGQPTFVNITVEVDESHRIDGLGGYQLKSRKAVINVFRPTVGTSTPNGVIKVGKADIDVNGMISAIDYEESAPYWAVKPFIDALEGK